MTQALHLITQLALVKHAAGYLTEAELVEVLEECIRTAMEYRVIGEREAA